jgi:RNA polymerase sigma-70 factor (ECF subfamily)
MVPAVPAAPEVEDDAREDAACAVWSDPSTRRRLEAFARRFVGDASEAEDIAQEALIRAGARLGSLRRAEAAEAWLFRICRHAAIDHVRMRAVRRGVWAAMPEHGEDQVADEGDPAERLGHDASDALDAPSSTHGAALLHALPAHHRLLMSLYYEHGLSQATICRMTNLSPSALRVRLFRARGALLARARAAAGNRPDA